MKDRGMMGPLDIIGEINRQFDKAILVTDVGQHQMLVKPVCRYTLENRQLIMSGGLGTDGGTAFQVLSVQRSEIQTHLSSLFPVTAACR